MNREETVALFLQGKEAWNVWAKKMFAGRKAMEADGRWAAEKDAFDEKPKNDETRAWLVAAAADFSRCLFLVRGAEGINEAAADEEETSRLRVESIPINGGEINFSGFVFPGRATFAGATFTGDAYFERATFSNGAYFSATFTP
jgi:hypothetical protein